MQVKTVENVISQAVAYRKKQNKFYEVLPHIGEIDSPAEINGWKFMPLEQDTSDIPGWALADLKAMQDRFPVKRVYIGHEPQQERKEPEKPKFKLPEIDTKRVASVLKAIGDLTFAALMGLWYVMSFLVFGVFSVVFMVDPIMVITFEGEEDWMLCVATWLDYSDEE